MCDLICTAKTSSSSYSRQPVQGRIGRGRELLARALSDLDAVGRMDTVLKDVRKCKEVICDDE